MEYLINMATVVLLPIVPAYLLFKLLPKTDGWVGGAFQGMDFKFSGAFAGYLMVLWVTHGYLPPQDLEVWMVEGEVEMDGDYHDVQISVIPDHNLSRDSGKFNFALVRPKNNDPTKRTIWIDAEDYQVSFKDIEPSRVSPEGVIKVEPIKLVPKYAEAAPYDETAFEPQLGGAR